MMNVKRRAAVTEVLTTIILVGIAVVAAAGI